MKKPPSFTTDFFSTKSFGPGHFLGAAVLGGTLFGVTRYLVRRSREQQTPSFLTSSLPPGPPPSQAAIAQNGRGTYGKSP